MSDVSTDFDTHTSSSLNASLWMFLKTLKNERYVQTSLSLEEYRGDYVNVYVKFTFYLSDYETEIVSIFLSQSAKGQHPILFMKWKFY